MRSLESAIAQKRIDRTDPERYACIAPVAIDRVFLTGGTSFVPAVRELFTTRFGPEKIQSGDEFTSIAQGLALQAEST